MLSRTFIVRFAIEKDPTWTFENSDGKLEQFQAVTN